MPYSCWLIRMCCAYAECVLLFLMCLICSWKQIFKLGWFGPHTIGCKKCKLVGKLHICYGVVVCGLLVVW